MLSLWLTFGGPKRSIYMRKIYKYYHQINPWTRNQRKSNEQDGFGWDDYQRFLKDFGFTRHLPQRVAKRIYIDVMSRERHLDDTSNKHIYRPPCLTFPQFRDLLIRIGYRMIEIERSSSTVGSLDLATGFYRVFLTMYERLIRFAQEEEMGKLHSVAAWPHLEMIRSASLSFAQNFQRITRVIQIRNTAESDAEVWIMKVMRRHLDLSTTVSELATKRRQRVEGAVDFEEIW